MNSRISRRRFLSTGAATGGAVLLGAGAANALLDSSSSASSGPGGSTAAGPGVNKGKPKKGGTAVIGTTAEIDGFFPPNNHWDVNGYLYANTVYDPLTAVAADGSVQPYLCQSLTPNATYTQWTLTLRSGIVFSDGSPLTGAVVKANFDALKASALTGTALGVVSSCTVSGPLSVVYTCSQPYVALPAALSTQVGYVVGQAMLDAAKSSSSAPKPIGTGPFLYSQWQPNSFFTATRNPHYWRSGYPYLNSITFKPIPDTSQREATLKSGGVDLIISNDPNTVDHFQGTSGYQVVNSLGIKGVEPDMDYIMLNCATPPTNDLRIRQALARGLQQSVIQKLFGGGLTAASNGPFPKGSPYYTNTGYPGYNPAIAKALVKSYKAQHGTPSLQLTTIPDPRLAKVVQVLQSMWKNVGFDVTIKSIEQAALINNAITGEFQAYTFEQFSAPDPSINYVWWSTTTVSPVGGIGLNFARNSDPKIEAALLTGRSTTSAATRKAAYQTVGKRLAIDLPYLWLGQTVWSEVGDSRIQNFAGGTLPNGSAAIAFDNGIFTPAQIWMKS
jgi:peptide/nickel transport system substrate-binding protein